MEHKINNQMSFEEHKKTEEKYSILRVRENKINRYLSILGISVTLCVLSPSLWAMEQNDSEQFSSLQRSKIVLRKALPKGLSENIEKKITMLTSLREMALRLTSDDPKTQEKGLLQLFYKDDRRPINQWFRDGAIVSLWQTDTLDFSEEPTNPKAFLKRISRFYETDEQIEVAKFHIEFVKALTDYFLNTTNSISIINENIQYINDNILKLSSHLIALKNARTDPELKKKRMVLNILDEYIKWFEPDGFDKTTKADLLSLSYNIEDLSEGNWFDNPFGLLGCLSSSSKETPVIQISHEFYNNVSAPDQIEQPPQIGFKALMKQIKENNKLSHISEDFIKTLLTTYSDESNTGQNFSLTGFLLPEKKLQKLIAYMELCKHIYTGDDTRGFVAQQTVPTMMNKWLKIISNKKEIDRLYQNLSEIRKQKDSITKQSLIYVREGTKNVPSKQVPPLSRKAQLPKLKEDYTDCIEETNTFLQKILNRAPIDHKDLKEITLAKLKLEEIKKEIDDEFSWHFEENTSNPITTITDSTDKKKYSLTSKAVVAASFLHKTQSLQDENITILDVGFRNLYNLQGMFNDFKEQLVKFKNNPTSWFEKWGEVDYVAYIKEDKTLKRKDKLVIVYSGSNSSKDWVSNITIGHTPTLNLSVHEGIGKLFQKSTSTYHNLLVDKIIHYYNNHRKPDKLKVITTGHSLGGALALLAAYHYKETQIQNFCKILGIAKDKISVKTFTFAAPAIADEPSQKRIEEVLGRNNIFRIWTFNDPVVYVSGKLDWHVGRNFPLYNIANNTFNLLDNLWGPHLAERYLCYLRALQEPLSESHKELTSILKKHRENIRRECLYKDR